MNANRLYRSRRGSFLGVCQGIAEWRDFPVSMVRFLFVVFAFVTGFFPVLLVYLILALVLPVEPKGSRRKDRPSDSKDRPSDPDVESDFENLKERVRKMEDEELDREADWERRFNKKK